VSAAFFVFLDPEGNPIELVSGVEELPSGCETKAVKPLSLSHAVLYVGDLSKQQSFYQSVLGMHVTDTVPRLMTFLRCNPNHHSFGFIALPRRGLQHAAFDLPSRADLLVHMGDAVHLLFCLSLTPFATAWMGENRFAANLPVIASSLRFPYRFGGHG
jgi:catechol-2,3-dioxygenase